MRCEDLATALCVDALYEIADAKVGLHVHAAKVVDVNSEIGNEPDIPPRILV